MKPAVCLAGWGATCTTLCFAAFTPFALCAAGAGLGVGAGVTGAGGVTVVVVVGVGVVVVVVVVVVVAVVVAALGKMHVAEPVTGSM